jgi:hypothetical protein
MNFFELGQSHAIVTIQVAEDWKTICLASGNDRKLILRRLSLPQNGERGSYRDGWRGTSIIAGKTEQQADTAYNRFVSSNIDEFAPGPTERARLHAAELEALVIIREKALELEAKSVKFQLAHEKLYRKYGEQILAFTELKDLAATTVAKRRRAMDEAIEAFDEANKTAKEAFAFEGREIDLYEEPSSRTLQEWEEMIDENAGAIRNVQEFMTCLRSKVDKTQS